MSEAVADRGRGGAPALLQDDPRAQRLLLLAGGMRLAHVVRALGELRVADMVADGPVSAEELARRAGAHPDALLRLLRCAASVGVFRELPGPSFGPTELSEGLREDAPGSVLPLVLYNGMELQWRTYGAIMHAVRTGEPAVPEALGSGLWEYLEERPETATRVYGVLNGMNRRLEEEYVAAVRPERFRRIADIGGGDGAFLSALLRRSPEAEGVLFELPSRMEETRRALEEYGCADRVTFVPGDFRTDPLPEGCDAYVMKGIVHNWDDGDALTILRAVRKAIGDSGAPLFAVEQIAAPPNSWDFGRFIDIDLLLIFGGRMRDADQWAALAAEAGFALDGAPVTGRWAAHECRPV
ncbi:methyltransferase [Nocardiopsis sp. RSe5-2]|uniref:Methyltransferase n=1 Tax=Nocardiopsis endophytica TaxID=3018445 RepID=A0ABT4U951_9ACTN|nr:methyltransferase [Nocardiopsis endophytica]MDA2812989.1 methyltransferase [Nocardiopsis endophytica]